MRSLEESRMRWRSLFNEPKFLSLSDLKQAVKSSEKDGPCEEGLRSVCWKAFLLHKGVDRSLWPAQLSDSREAYSSLRQHFLRFIENPNDLPSTVDPLAEDDECWLKSPWESLRRDESIREEIFQDVERCLQENHFFCEPTTKTRMLDILFVFVKLNPDLGYRQGMHELLAPILWVVSQDAIDLRSGSHDAMLSEDDTDLILRTLDSDFIEHDSFTLFCAIMQTAKLFYEHDAGNPTPGNPAVAPIVARSQYIHEVILREIDPQLADHLVEIEILPQIFLTRWIRLLFGREFPFDEVLIVWDLLMSENLRPELIDIVCITMILRIRWQLLSADYPSGLRLLLRYPSPEPYKPRSFVLDALYLEQNMTPEGASHLVAKYSGKPSINRVRSTGVSTQTRGGLIGRQKNPSIIQSVNTRASENSSPTSSLVKGNQKRLDSLFQDVTKGFHQRTESWGVAKAVRGAVVEARRNIQSLQSSASSPGLLNADDIMPDPPSPPQMSLATVRELNSRLITLDKRNKTLASMLEGALTELRSQASKNNETAAENGPAEEADPAIAKIRQVQHYLEDSTIPISEEERDARKVAQDISNSAPTGIITSTPTKADTPKTTPSEGSGAQTTMNGSDDVEVASPSSGTATSTSGLLKPIPIHPATRTPLRESSFSWILGNERPASSFAACSSTPPEQRREPSASLFGDSRDDQRAKRLSGNGKDALLLSRLDTPPR